MAVVHLIDRFTRDRNVFVSNMESVFSYVLVSEGTHVDAFEISLTVGQTYTKEFPAREEQFREMSEEGVLIDPSTSILFSTTETLRLPFNMFGVVFPKGSLFIRYAIIVPTTKIDPGFSDSLYIFVRNEGSRPYRMKKGDVIASVSFFTTDSTPSDVPETRKPSFAGRMPSYLDTWKARLSDLRSRIWDILLALIGGGVLLAILQNYFGG
jgi:deoxycytidine triphosphate deaminase